MRALPADSLEYFGDTTVGNAALLGAIAGLAAVVVAGFFSSGFAAVGVGANVVVALSSEPHSALRKSFYFMPLSVPAFSASLYLALHSFMVSACDGPAKMIVPATASALNVKLPGVFMVLTPTLGECATTRLRHCSSPFAILATSLFFVQ
jgi:hypothetical protein